MESFARRFKQLRLETGKLQEELLAEFNNKYHHSYTATAISRYENGKRYPEITALLNFADYFGVSVSYLLGESDVRNPDVGVAAEMINAIVPNEAGLEKARGEQEKELLHAFRALSPTGKSAAVNQVMALAEMFPAENKKEAHA